MITRFFNYSQLKNIIAIVFKGKTLLVERINKHAGTHQKSCWVSYINKHGRRWSTFISIRELNRAFWQWLTTIKKMELTHNEKFLLGWAIFTILKPGDAVFKGVSNNLGVVVNKRIEEGTRYAEVLVDWGNEAIWERATWLEVF
ncbi:MAG: hypothetical protein ACRC2R_09870 [Xenococcaceae cyanobacterium]